MFTKITTEKIKNLITDNPQEFISFLLTLSTKKKKYYHLNLVTQSGALSLVYTVESKYFVFLNETSENTVIIKKGRVDMYQYNGKRRQETFRDTYSYNNVSLRKTLVQLLLDTKEAGEALGWAAVEFIVNEQDKEDREICERLVKVKGSIEKKNKKFMI